jgi:phosphopantetheinyl transferase (holo-ACP synthase)
VIGNDIVDLALARKESNWKRPGYLNKIFTTKEQLLISSAENPNTMVWNLWSRKEAAYKIIIEQREYEDTFKFRMRL